MLEGTQDIVRTGDPVGVGEHGEAPGEVRLLFEVARCEVGVGAEGYVLPGCCAVVVPLVVRRWTATCAC